MTCWACLDFGASSGVTVRWVYVLRLFFFFSAGLLRLSSRNLLLSPG